MIVAARSIVRLKLFSSDCETMGNGCIECINRECIFGNCPYGRVLHVYFALLSNLPVNFKHFLLCVAVVHLFDSFHCASSWD